MYHFMLLALKAQNILVWRSKTHLFSHACKTLYTTAKFKRTLFIIKEWVRDWGGEGGGGLWFMVAIAVHLTAKYV